MAGRSIGLIALACSAAAVTWLAAQTAAPQVFILSGQSNMVGQGRTADLPDALTRLPPNVTYYLNGEPTSFAAQPQFGPEVSFTHELANAWPGEPIIVIKFAVGGTSLLAWAPEWRQALARRTRNENQGPLYQRLMGYIASAEIGPRPRLAAVLWMQGERDARYPPGRVALPVEPDDAGRAASTGSGVPHSAVHLRAGQPPDAAVSRLRHRAKGAGRGRANHPVRHDGEHGRREQA